MGLGLIYWIGWVLALLGGVAILWPFTSLSIGLFIIWQVMLFLLGWKLFGLPISGSTE